MTYHVLRDRMLLTLGSTMISGILLAAAAQASNGVTNSQAITEGSSTAAPSGAAGRHFWDVLQLENRDAWSELRSQLAWHEQPLSARAQERVDNWIDYYQSSPENILTIGRRASSWLAWINQQVSERGLPGEIALVPFIESSFDPRAKSHRGAAGLWQFMPGTGDALGLVRNAHYDGRLDVVASTQAALDYIEMQADQWYEGDLKRSLAAYNAGAGTVNRAVRRSQAQGQPGDYWDLQLPRETMNYVPKLLAIARIIANPSAYDVTLPEIAATPAFAMVDLEQGVSLEELARRSGVDADTLSELNPGLLNGSLNPRYTRTLLMPGDSSAQMLAELGTSLNADNDKETTLASTSTPQTHRVEPGDNLSTIAQRYNISLRDIMRWNAIDRPEALQPGQLLTLSSS
ncbi:transglycosylase SLT domain-containing protein [Halomonas sp. BLK-85]